MRQQIVEFTRALANKESEYLALFLAFQIGGRRGSGQIELWRVARVLGHCSGHHPVERFTSIARRMLPVKADLSSLGASCVEARCAGGIIDNYGPEHDVVQETA